MLSARASVDAASRLREPMDAFATREDRMRHRTRRRVRVAAGGRVVAQLLRRLRQMPDRLLHPRRRRAALESLIARQPPARVLVVCNGNIFRSPFAAAVLRRVAGPRGVQVESARFLGPGRPATRDTRTRAGAPGTATSRP